MHLASTRCLPAGPTLDPWFELYMGATLCPDCFNAAAALIPGLPPTERGNAWAVAARAYMVLGQPGEAVRAWELAEELGGHEVEALASFVRPDGHDRAVRRATTAGQPAVRADRWCDVAALRVIQRRGEGAGAALAEALAACPDHLEAHHWLRFLAQPDALREADRMQGRPSRRGRSLAAQDAAVLVPHRANGWVSTRRLNARLGLEAGPPLSPAGSGLRHLEDAGLHALYLGSDDDYRGLPARHPLVRAELQLAAVSEHVDEGRPASALARASWHAALASGDRQRVQDVAEQLCALTTRAADLLEVGGECADWLASVSPEPTLFRAYGAWIAAARGAPDAQRRAEAVLSTGAADELAWRLAVGALYRLGASTEADACVAAARRNPRLRAIAATLRGKRARPGEPQVHCSPRLRSRAPVEPEAALFS
jgi:hypothetical protein